MGKVMDETKKKNVTKSDFFHRFLMRSTMQVCLFVCVGTESTTCVWREKSVCKYTCFGVGRTTAAEEGEMEGNNLQIAASSKAGRSLAVKQVEP